MFPKSQLIISKIKKIFLDQEKRENNLLESNEKDSFDTLKGNTKGKHCFRKNFWQISKSSMTVLSLNWMSDMSNCF